MAATADAASLRELNVEGDFMVDFIGIERVRELVARRGTARFIAELAAEIEADFRRWEHFDKSPRHASHSSGGVIELMPASDGRLYAFKYVNGHPRNTAVGLLTVTAFGVLADVATGYPLLLSELTLTTALRTAATSALAARHMARADSRVMALIGNGAQSEFQAIAFHHLLGIREVRLFDVDRAATDKLGWVTRAPPREPRLTLIRSSASRMRNASRSVGLDTPNCTISCCSDGRVSPGRSSPRTIWRRYKVAMSSAVLGARTTWPTYPGAPRPASRPARLDTVPPGGGCFK